MYEELLTPIKKDLEKYGYRLQQPAMEAEIKLLESNAKKELGAALPPEYISLLCEVNGLDYNGFVFYATHTLNITGFEDRTIEGFVEANMAFRDVDRFRDFLVFGGDGEVLYVYRLSAKKYLSIDAVALDEADPYGSFREMLQGAIDTHA
ncbi:MAG: YrhA family protein [Candidatus Eremiobacteraeota bacterium]|nr:YrhA family protein [Candidatus Eremiobacteraeota bacterium]